MTVTFKSGRTLKISQDVANELKQRILEDCNNWQVFMDENGVPFLFLKLSEIESIK